MCNFDCKERQREAKGTPFDLFLPSRGDEEGPDELIGGETRREEREGISGMAGDPQCVRVLGPFRQAPAQQGGRDNHAAPDSVHRDGGMEGR